MIFYKNIKKKRHTKEKNLVFSIFQDGIITDKNDAILSPSTCKNSYNISFCDGILKTGLGFEDIKAPQNDVDIDNCHTFDFASRIDEVQHLWFNRWYNNYTNMYYYHLLMTASDNMLYYIVIPDDFEGNVLIRTPKLKNKHYTFSTNYRIDNVDSLIYFTEEGMIYLTYDGELTFTNVPPMISCVVHYGNFFGITNTNRNTLVYTTNLNLKKWDNEQSSTIEFLDNRGSFTKLILFNDYVYLFREYGITKISLYSSKDNFSFTHLYSSTSKIYEDSVCVCGDVVMFVARDGVYKFNGTSVSRAFQDLDGYIKNCDNSKCSAACLEGKYYLATNCNFSDENIVGCEQGEYINNVLFAFDLENEKATLLRGVDIREVLAVNLPFTSKLVACFYNENKQKVGELNSSGEIFGISTSKVWESAFTDLGEVGKRKHIKELYITSQFDCEFEIVSDEETKKYAIFGQKNEQRLQISTYGKHFKFIFKTDKSKIEISKPVVVFDVLQ